MTPPDDWPDNDKFAALLFLVIMGLNGYALFWTYHAAIGAWLHWLLWPWKSL